ncbi:hypothetical protein T4B_13384 [Trichinella pseudospiralis]|uniref:Uncharacterized protein n=1 Tax=Trichinella pseudospiralis TaxID=6337 RepID=A0A0V1IWP9_TRIPS|nr:hypothetical protein T4B_13384 [Trichinella pseudospiralis]KRZ32506.1 hypothetical protein T4C_13509 [Trichinella pseudospiralis]
MRRLFANCGQAPDDAWRQLTSVRLSIIAKCRQMNKLHSFRHVMGGANDSHLFIQFFTLAFSLAELEGIAPEIDNKC